MDEHYSGVFVHQSFFKYHGPDRKAGKVKKKRKTQKCSFSASEKKNFNKNIAFFFEILFETL
jgi:hypothetical protein